MNPCRASAYISVRRYYTDDSPGVVLVVVEEAGETVEIERGDWVVGVADRDEEEGESVADSAAVEGGNVTRLCTLTWQLYAQWLVTQVLSIQPQNKRSEV